jgi:YHS domain-containing protein
MNVIVRFVRFVVWVLVLSWILKLLGKFAMWALRRAVSPEQQSGAVGNASGGPAQSWAESLRSGADATGEPQTATRHLVRDPVCGMHLAETLAIPFRDGGELMHFCSAECRDKYANGILRRAANG